MAIDWSADTITISNGRRALVSMSDEESHLSDGCGRVFWDVTVPAWHNDLRYYRDVIGYSWLTVTRSTNCATCGGMNSVPSTNARNGRRVWKRCPAHTPAHETPETVAGVPSLADVLRRSAA